MKTQTFFLGLFILLCFSFSGFAQKAKTTTENMKVWGNCGMCKKTIETAAKSAGVTEANWNKETRILAVTYNTSKADNQKIQKAVAAVGYDTQDFTAPDDVYSKLHGCCQYDRKAASATQQAVSLTTISPEKANCCDTDKCSNDKACCKDMKGHHGKDAGKEMDCCKDGKCEKDKHMAVCKEKGCCKS
jgi:hypothetical protein